MTQPKDTIDAGGAITDLVFEENHQERRSWPFCNSIVPRSEVVFYPNFHNSFSYRCFFGQIGVF